MSYLVLARKWRPQRFNELVGQGHVVRSLSHALTSGRVGHAFLLSGSRGVGKTTLGRLLAKGLNCGNGITAEPCGECGNCQAIEEGRFIDLIEVDAASRTRVDDTRELLDNVQYLPTMGRFKVYLVDEVHMLSSHSFNALLKTLEEPPDHVKFVLATTEPAKIPVTILSRCLQFDLRRIPPEGIAERLRAIAGEEGIPAEEGALELLARAADGSLRDGLSLLDQAVNYGDGQVSTEAVREMLGTVNRDRILALLEAIAARDGEAALERVAEVSTSGVDLDGALAELLGLLHRVAVMQAVPQRGQDDPTLVTEERTRLEALAGQTSPEDIQLFYQIGLQGQRDLEAAPDPRAGVEMAVIRMVAFDPLARQETRGASGDPGVSGDDQSGSGTDRDAKASQASGTGPDEGAGASTGMSPQGPRDEGEAAPNLTEGGTPEGAEPSHWEATLGRLEISPAWRALLEYSVAREFTEERVRLGVPRTHLAAAESQRFRSALEDSLVALFGRAPRVTIEALEAEDREEGPASSRDREQREAQAVAEQALDRDPHAQALRERFGARVESVKPDGGDGEPNSPTSGGAP